MIFQIEQEMPLNGSLVYRADEHSFDTVLRGDEGYASLLVNDLQLEVDEQGRVLFVWGMCPHASWTTNELSAPEAQPGRLRVEGVSLPPGVSKRVNADERWHVAVNRESGWICIGDPSAEGESTMFAPGAIAVLAGGLLKSLWLKPVELPES